MIGGVAVGGVIAGGLGVYVRRCVSYLFLCLAQHVHGTHVDTLTQFVLME